MKKVLSLLAVSLLASSAAHAEFSVGLLGGLANYTTTVRGDALFPYGGAGFYYNYPQDINTKVGAIGPLFRYTYSMSPCFSLGGETGYIYVNLNEKRLRSDNVPAFRSPRNVENFTTQSNGLVLLNALFRFNLNPCLAFNVFGGPAWLNTKYIANEFASGATRTAGSTYQLTADAGVEAEWKFACNFSVGMRFDYIFDTNNRTVSTTGSLGDPLLVDMKAKSGLVLTSATLRYIIPCS